MLRVRTMAEACSSLDLSAHIDLYEEMGESLLDEPNDLLDAANARPRCTHQRPPITNRAMLDDFVTERIFRRPGAGVSVPVTMPDVGSHRQALE